MQSTADCARHARIIEDPHPNLISVDGKWPVWVHGDQNIADVGVDPVDVVSTLELLDQDLGAPPHQRLASANWDRAGFID